MKSFMFLGNPWLWPILSAVSQFTPQTTMYTACKKEPNILWKHVSTTYLLAASIWQNFMELKQPILSAQQSSTTAKMSGLQNRTLNYRSSPTGKLEDSSQFMMICYYTAKNSSTGCHSTSDLIKDSLGPSRNTKVPLTSQHFCLVAWYLKAHQRLDRAMPHLCKRVLLTRRTTDSYRSPRLPLAENSNRFILYEWGQIPTCC